MKKLIMILTIIMFIVPTSISQASNSTELQNYNIKEIHSKIEKLYFEPDSGYYIVHTKKDKDGKFWVFYLTGIIIPSENKQLTKELNKTYLNKNVTIIVGVSNVNEEDEILNIWITK